MGTERNKLYILFFTPLNLLHVSKMWWVASQMTMYDMICLMCSQELMGAALVPHR